MVYEKPEMIVVCLEEDVICTSTLIENNANGGNGDQVQWISN